MPRSLGWFVASILFVTACGDREPAVTPGGASPAGLRGIEDAAGIPAARMDEIVDAFNRGISLMEQYRPSDAAAAFQSVVEMAPEWTLARLDLGIALLNEQTDESSARAEQELRRVATEVPDDPHAHHALGMLFRHLSRFAEARQEFERVLAIDPDDADAHYQLAILVIDDDQTAARTHLERTLARVPHHESACYRLQSLLRQAGETERADELLRRFSELKAAKAGVTAGMKYGEMGRHADVVRRFLAAGEDGGADHVVPDLADIADGVGLDVAGHGVAGWPGSPAADAAGGPAIGPESFGPGVAIADVDGDGDLDLYLTGSGADGGVLWQRTAGAYTVATTTGIDGRGAVGAWFGDYDLDGDPDLYLTCAGPNRLYRNDGEGRFTDVTAASGTAGGAFLSVGAAWADFDHDGDLDLFVANWSAWPVDPAKPPGAPNALLRNNGTGTFTDVAAQCGVDGGMVASIGVQVLDLDDDRDLDLCVINHGESSRLFRNDRVGRYADATDLLPGFAEAAPGTGACVADVDGNGLEDLLLLRGRQPPRLWLQESRGRFAEDRSFAALIGPQSGAVGGTFADLDLDGDLDLVLVGAGSSDRVGHRLLMNHGRGRFSAPVTFGPQNALPDARGTVATDLDGDGAIDLLVARAGATPQLWRCNPPAGRNWLVVEPGVERAQDAAKPEPMVVGLHVEVKAGLTVQVARVAATSGCLGSAPPLLHFGLGAKRKADYVRLLWPDAVLQSEMEVAAGQRWRVAKVERKPSSCPVLFVWDGSRFAFVTDFLGTGGVGFFVEPGVYAPPDPTEDVRIPPELVAQDRGRYLLRVTEPLEEVTYLDQLELRVYDHPAGYEVHPDERFTSTPPFPTGAPILIAEKVFPVAAHDDRGEPVLDRLIEIDRRYCEPPALAGFKGYAADHWFELDFGDRLHALPSGSMPWLFLHGFVEYTYSHVNYAAWQAGLAMRPPSIEVPDGRGGWRTAIADAGFPAGLPRTMTVDLSSLPLGADGRLRLRTNMRVFWDQAFVAVEAGSTELVRSVLAPSVAELRFLGYPRDYSPDGAEPTIHDYQRVDPSAAFKAMTGDFTRYGDVRALLAAADDRYVLMARGDEIALEFDASALPPLTPGFARTLVLHADGWCKDMDLYTAFPDTVEPLPFHGMTNYPPDTAPPADLERDEVLRRFNTRRHEGR